MIYDRKMKFRGNSFTINSSNSIRNVVQPAVTCSSVVTNKNNELESYLNMSPYNVPLGDNIPNVQNHTTYTIRTLADMFTCKLSNFPMTVGIFTQQSNKEYLSQLANELHNLDRLENPMPLKFSKLLFLFPLVISAILGYFVGMLTNWQVGLSIGHIGMFIQITFLALIITGSRFCHKPMAIRASYSIACFLQWLKLFLSVCFCYPEKSVNTKTPTRIIVVYHRICPSSTTNMALFSLMEKMWFSLVRHYGQILIRLQRAGRPAGIPNCKYKRVCCLPAFLVMIAFWIAFVISTSIMRLYSGQLAKLLGHGGLLSLFVIMSSVMFLSFFGSLPSLFRIIKGLLINPITPVKTALSAFLQTENDADKDFFSSKSVGKVNEAALLSNSTSFKDLAISAEEQRACKADLFIKSEFAKICNLSVTFDRFTNTQQTRFILCLDASGTLQKDLLAKLIYQIHNLILSDMSAPVAIVLEANFRILLGDLVCSAVLSPRNPGFCSGLPQEPKFLAQILGDNFHLVHASLHLPIYLEPPIFTDFPEQITESNDQSQHNQLFCSPLNGYSSGVCTSNTTSATTLTMNPSSTKMSFSLNCMPTNVPRANFDNFYRIHSNSQRSSKMSSLNPEAARNNSDFTKEHHQFNVHDIASMFLHNHELADWNGKIIKQLVLSTMLTSRLLKLYNMNVEIEMVIVWITLVHHWPYHTAWLIIHLEDLNKMNSENLNKEQNLQLQVSLTEAFLEVKKRVGQSIETLEPLAIEDRDLEKLNTFLYAKASTPIPLNNLKQLIVCTLVHNPFIRYSLQALVGKVNEPHHPALHHNFVNPLDALVEERSGSANYTFGLSKVGQSNSVPLYTTIQHNASRAQTNQIGCTTTGSISSAENIPSNPSWPCSSDTITTGDNFANKPCFLRLNTRCPSIPLNQFTVSDVCQLFASITDIHPSNMHTYLTRIKQLKINGIILSVCNLEKLQQELLINSTDWQLIHKLLTCLRSSTNDGFSAFSENSQQPVRGPSLHEFEVNDSTAGSNNTFKTKTQQPQHHLSNHTSITSVLSLNSDKLSQSSDSKLKKPNHFLVRQTPWLISPKIPLTSLTSNGKSLEPFQEFPYQQHPSPDSSDQQNSCSAMEEPESLWKTSSLLHVRTNLNKNSLGQQQENRLSVVNEKPNILSNSNPFSNMENLSGSKEIKAPEKHFNKSQLTSSVSGGTAMPRYTFNKDIQKSLQSNWFAIKNGYASRSSVDLRTVFGPEQKPTSSSQLFGNCKAIRNSKRHRVKKALVEQHRRRQQQCLLTPTPNFSYVTDPGFCPAGFVCPVSNPGANLYNQELMNCTSLRYDPDLQNLRLPSLRRVIKQPRHKYDYKTFVNNATIINNVDKNNACGSGNVSPINNLGPNKAQIKQNCIYEAANNNSTDTDDTIPSSDNKSSQLNFCSRNKVFLDHLKQYPHAFHGPAVFSSPALTPSQLASLQTYAAWSTKMNPYFTNPTVLTNIGSVLPSDVNNAWKSYLQQHQPNISLLMKTNTHQKSNHKAFKPSQKKRPRKTNSEDEKTIIDQTTEFSSSCLMNPHTNSMPVPSDSEAEMCTCDYWYEVEKAREKFTISEPSLRGESDLISVDDFVLENGSQ